MSNKIILENNSIAFLQNNAWQAVTSNVSFSIKKGTTVAMVGESGSGKSITALSLLKLLPKDICLLVDGKIYLESEQETIEYNEHPESWVNLRGRGIAMVFQNALSGLNPTFTCGAQIADVLAAHHPEKNNKNHIYRLFEEVKLPNPSRIYKSYPHQLSGGQLQRVMIAMALACEPDFLIADEPTTALDPSLQLEVLDLFKSIQAQRNLGILFITHDLHLIKSFAHELGVMYAGELVDYGPVADILENPTNDYTRALLHCKPSIDFKQNHLPTVEDLLNNNPAPLAEAKERKIRWEETPILEAKNIGKTYIKKSLFGKTEKVVAAKNVHLEVFKNEAIGIVGESGSGKSTVAQILCGLVRSDQGRVRLNRKKILVPTNACRKEWAKSVQMIFQDPYSSLNPKQKIIQQIEEVIRVHKTRKGKTERKKFARELLKRVGLDEDLFLKYPHQLSGGQLQRASIARILAVEPKVIICDESVSALDVSVQAHILNLLKKLKEIYELSFVFIAHDMAVVRYFCDRVMVMHNGIVVEEGLVSNVFNKPTHPYTKKLMEIGRKLT